MSSFGKLTKIMPNQYDEVNAIMRSILRAPEENGKNLIVTRKFKEKYVSAKTTNKDGSTGTKDSWDGTYIPSGYKDTPYLVQCNVEQWYDKDEMAFKMRFDDCRLNMGLTGSVLTDSEIDFMVIASMIYEDDFNEGDWT
jgi:hypothetical protein